MFSMKKHPIQRRLDPEAQKFLQKRSPKVETRVNNQAFIVRPFKHIKSQFIEMERTGREMSLRVRPQQDSLPKLSTSAHKISPNSNPKTTPNIHTQLSITSSCWCLFDPTTKQYHGFRQQYRREIASLTKIMTTYLAIKFIQQLSLPLNCMVRVTGNAAELGGTSAGLKEGVWVYVEDLLYGTMLPSGNDAAYTLAEYVGYLLHLSQKSKHKCQAFASYQQIDLTTKNTAHYVQQFISKMNEKAIKLGLFNTRFSNPHGLQNALNTSSAKDITILSQQAIKVKLFSKVMNTYYHKYQLFQGENFRSTEIRRWWNTNKLLQKGWEGVKTGHTVSAGSCLCSLRQGILITVLNSDSAESRFSDTEKIYQWYCDRYARADSSISIGIDKFCETYSKVFTRRLPSMLTEISL